MRWQVVFFLIGLWIPSTTAHAQTRWGPARSSPAPFLATALHQPESTRPDVLFVSGQAPGKPQVTVLRIVGEVVVGTVGSWAGGTLVYVVADRAATDHRVKGDAGYSPTANAGFLLGSALGNALGVYLIGSLGDTEGSFWATLAGSALASLPLLINLDDPYLVFLAFVAAPLFPSLGSIIGFNVSRRHASPADAATALLNVRDGRMSLDVPTLTFQPDPLKRLPFVQQIALAHVRF